MAGIFRGYDPAHQARTCQRSHPDLDRALGEFGATILFAGNLEGVTQTMPMAIYLGFERNLGVAVALSVVLIFVSVILLMVTKNWKSTKINQPVIVKKIVNEHDNEFVE